MRIPVYQNTEEIRPTQASDVPRTPTITPEAAGVGVAQEQEKLGQVAQAAVAKVGNDVIEHIQLQKAHNEKILKDDFENKFKLAYQEQAYDQTLEEYGNPDPLTGVKPQRPKGIMLQVGEQATDAYSRSKKNFDELATKFVTAMPADDRVKKEWLASIEPYRVSTSLSASEHGAKQYRVSLAKTGIATLTNLSNEAETAQDPKLLNPLLDRVVEKSNLLSDTQGDTPDIRQKVKDDWILKATQKAVIGKLMTTGKIDEAMNLLDSAKEKIPQETYDTIKEKVNKVGEQVASDNKRNATVEKIGNEFDAFTKLANGELDLTNSDDVIRAFAVNDMEFATALKVAVNTRGRFEPSSDNDAAYADIIKNVFKSGSKEEIANVLKEALSSTGRKQISQDKLSIIASAALLRGKGIRELNSDPKLSTDPKQTAIDAGLKAITSCYTGVALPDIITHYLQGVISGKPAEQAHKEAVTNNIIKQNPDLIKFPEGRIGIDKKDGFKYRYFFDGRPREKVK